MKYKKSKVKSLGQRPISLWLKKSKILTIIFILLITIIPKTYAAPSSPSATVKPTSSLIDKLKKIELLKEKIATKVAEIRENDKIGLSGIVKNIGKSALTIGVNNEDKKINYSEDTIFYSLTGDTKTEITPAKVKEGDTVSILGYIDSGKTVISSKYIFVEKSTSHLIGKILDIDKSNYTITVKDPSGNFVVDIETYSKITAYTKEKGILKSSFSKLKSGDTVHILGTPNEKEKNRISALRIIAFSLNQVLSPTPSITVQPTSELKETTKSGVKAPVKTKSTSQ